MNVDAFLKYSHTTMNQVTVFLNMTSFPLVGVSCVGSRKDK